MHPVMEEDVVEIVNTANPVLLQESTEHILINQDFLVLLMMDELVRPVPPAAGLLHWSHLS